MAMTSTKEKFSFVPSFPEAIALTTAVVLGVWSAGWWTALVALLLCYLDYKVELDPFDLGIRGKIARRFLLLFAMTVLLHFIFPNVVFFVWWTRVFSISMFADLVKAMLPAKPSVEEQKWP